MIYYCTLLNGHYCELIITLFHHYVTFIVFFPVRSHELTVDLYVWMCVNMKERDSNRERESDTVTVFIIRVVNILV